MYPLFWPGPTAEPHGHTWGREGYRGGGTGEWPQDVHTYIFRYINYNKFFRGAPPPGPPGIYHMTPILAYLWPRGPSLTSKFDFSGPKYPDPGGQTYFLTPGDSFLMTFCSDVDFRNLDSGICISV